MDVLGARNANAVGVGAVCGGGDVEVRQDSVTAPDDRDVVILAVQAGQPVDFDVVGIRERQCLPPIGKC